MPTARKDRLAGPVMAIRTFTKDDGSMDLDKQAFALDWVVNQGIQEGSGVIMLAAGPMRKKGATTTECARHMRSSACSLSLAILPADIR